MNRRLLLVHPVFVLLAGAICTNAALADSTNVADPTIPDSLRNFRFITSHSTVEQSGGLPLYTIDWNVAGKFGLATGYDGLLTPTPTATTTPPTISGHASFENVNAYMFHPQSRRPCFCHRARPRFGPKPQRPQGLVQSSVRHPFHRR